MKSLKYAVVLALGPCLSGCTPPEASCPLNLDADLPVTYIEGHLPVVTVNMGGHDITMLVDSGAQISSLSTATYRRLNLTGTAPVRGYSTGIGGNVESNVVIMEDLKFGVVRLKNEVLDVNDGIVPARNGKPLVDGLFGYDILGSFDIALDMPNNRIMLFDRQTCTGALTPWPGEYAPVPITTNKESLITTIAFTIDGQDLNGLIDTGADVTVVAKQALDRLGIKPKSAPQHRTLTLTGIGIHQAIFALERFDNVQIGAETIDNKWLLVADTPMSEFNDMALGEDYLAHHRVFISNSTNTVYLSVTLPHGG